MKGTTVRGKRSDTGSTAVWLLLNHLSPEDEEQAAGLEKADLQEARKAPDSSLQLGLTTFSLTLRRKAEKATAREGCGSKKEELRVSRLPWSVFPD